jgi:hypothetical protein
MNECYVKLKLVRFLQEKSLNLNGATTRFCGTKSLYGQIYYKTTRLTFNDQYHCLYDINQDMQY